MELWAASSAALLASAALCSAGFLCSTEASKAISIGNSYPVTFLIDRTRFWHHVLFGHQQMPS
jgi:hypothetical protein